MLPSQLEIGDKIAYMFDAEVIYEVTEIFQQAITVTNNDTSYGLSVNDLAFFFKIKK